MRIKTHLHGRRLLVAGLTLAVIAGASALAARARRGAAPISASALLAPVDTAATSQAQPVEPLEVISLAITPAGFDPAEISLTKERFALYLQNRSGITDLNLQLSRTTGNKDKLRDVKIRGRKKADWVGVIDLQPGEFVLRDPAYPEWECRIITASR